MKQEFYNEYRKQVTDYILRGETLFTTSLREASQLALRFKTYHYEMFTYEWNSEKGYNEFNFIGYGVLKK